MYGHFTERHGLTITGDRKPFYTKHMRRRAWLMQALWFFDAKTNAPAKHETNKWDGHGDFFVVWVSGSKTSKFQHGTEQSACYEAYILSELTRRKVYVLKSRHELRKYNKYNGTRGH